MSLREDAIASIEKNRPRAIELVLGNGDIEECHGFAITPNSSHYYNIGDCLREIGDHGHVLLSVKDMEDAVEGVQNSDQLVVRLAETCYLRRLQEEIEERIGRGRTNIDLMIRGWSRYPRVLALARTRVDEALTSGTYGASIPGFVASAKGWVSSDS